VTIRRHKVKKNVKRATLVLAMTPLLAVPATAALAASTGPVTASVPRTVTAVAAPAAPASSNTSSGTTTTVTHQNAPKATASAVAAKVAGVITIGETGATAGSDGGTAHAHALDILGTTVSGDDVTDGSKSGSLFSTPDNPIGDLELAPWSGTVAHNGGGTQSQAEAALAHAGLLGVLQVWLLHSQSQATWTPDASHGHSESDGAEVNLADQLDVKVLHAETDSDGKGSSAILVINGTGILTSDQTGNACDIPADPLIDLLCLQATGGKGSDGSTTSTAEVVKETSGVGLPGGDIVGASSGGGKAVTPSTPGSSNPGTSTKHGTRHTSGGRLPHTSGQLPFTGGETGLLAAYGALLAGLGTAITAAARRRRPGAVA
jgi:hypothetical protein